MDRSLQVPGGGGYPPRRGGKACPAPSALPAPPATHLSNRGFPFGPSHPGWTTPRVRPGRATGETGPEQRSGALWGGSDRGALPGLDSDYLSRPPLGWDDPSPACTGLPSEPTLRYPSRAALGSRAETPPPDLSSESPQTLGPRCQSLVTLWPQGPKGDLSWPREPLGPSGSLSLASAVSTPGSTPRGPTHTGQTTPQVVSRGRRYAQPALG